MLLKFLITKFNKKIIFRLSQVILLIWVFGFIFFINNVRNLKEYQGDLKNIDYIIVLTGAKERISEGMHLLIKNINAKLLISGVSQEVYIKQIKEIYSFHKISNSLMKQITLGRLATNTIENCIESDIWLELNIHNINKKNLIVVVSSDYHIPRAKILFDNIIKNNSIIYHPVSGINFKISKWWDFPGTTKLLFIEYNKFLVQYFLNIFWYEYD